MTEESAIDALVAQLESLHDGQRAMMKLIALGEEAIPHVRKFLLDGKPGTVFEPRQWAVEALGALGAKDVLLEYLRLPRPSNPAVAFAEEAVAITAARELQRWRADDVFEALLHVVSMHLQPGAIEALGEFRRTEALPYLIRGLGDGVCRTAAEEALHRYGTAAAGALITAALDPKPSLDAETASSLQRRTSALKLVALTVLSHEQWHMLAPLLDNVHPAIVAASGRLALLFGSAADRQTAERRLREVRPDADWMIQADIDECLTSLRDRD